mmetsp:Transcript_32409/g.79560  ORF Transcript_32409/g.79560 Transcript_32409/m.79560 type:complete len:190 (+) Transcript_32409:147-716(+)
MAKAKAAKRCMVGIAAMYRRVLAGPVSGEQQQDLLEITRQLMREEACEEGQTSEPVLPGQHDVKKEKEGIKKPAADWEPPRGGWWAFKMLSPGGEHEGQAWMDDILKPKAKKRGSAAHAALVFSGRLHALADPVCCALCGSVMLLVSVPMQGRGRRCWWQAGQEVGALQPRRDARRLCSGCEGWRASRT